MVIERAVSLADRARNIEAVTLTSLAAALDIRVPSLYNHIAGLDDLRDALAVYALQELLMRVRVAASGQVGQKAIVAVAVAYRDFAQAHPGIYALTLRGPAPDETFLTKLAQELLQILLLIFASFGIHGDEAIHAVRGLRALLHGFASLDAAGGFKMAVDRDESYYRAIIAYLAGLPVASKVRY
jgi:AcrR family transcriptional regulator